MRVSWSTIEKIEKKIPKCILNTSIAVWNNIKVARGQYKLLSRQKCNKDINSKIRIVFIVQRTEVFNSVRSIFEAAIKDGECEVYLLPLPRCSNDLKGFFWNTYETVINYCKQLNGGIVINTYNFESKQYFDLTDINPDYIFLNVPYTDEYPKMYSMDHLASIAKVCYVPYGYAMPNENRLPMLYSSTFFTDLMKSISFIFADSDTSYVFCKKYRMWLSELLYGQKLYNIGYPRFDKINIQHNQIAYNTILWLPRWTAATQISEGNIASHFFDYKNNFPKYVNQKEKCKLIIRPHPLMFENFVRNGFMTRQEVQEYRESIEKNNKLLLDENTSYEKSFDDADYLVSDYSSTIIEFFLRGKPIVYCGQRDELSPQIEFVTRTFYYVDGWNKLEETLETLMRGIDPLKEERLNAIKRFRYNSQNAGQEILEIIKKDFNKYTNSGEKNSECE